MIALAPEEGTFIPTAAQHHLLRAALLADRDAVLASLAAWKASVRFEDLELGARRLLPLLYRNLKKLELADELMPRLKGVYRQVWFRNQLILREGAGAVRALQSEGIPVLLIKGAALVSSVYADVALRPMDDFDVVVPRQSFRRATEALRRHGWRVTPEPGDLEPHLEFRHALALRREGSGDLDLHWTSTYGAFHRSAESESWQYAQEVKAGGETVRILAPPDQLLQICVHATLPNLDVAPIRWIPDALFILAHAGTSFDWQRLIEIARRRSMSHVLLRCLGYLREGFALPVPLEVLNALRRNASLRERVLLRIRLARGPGQRWYSAMVWMRLVFLDGWTAVPRRLSLLGRFLRSIYDVPDDAHLSRFIIRKILRAPLASPHPNRDTTPS
jgi:Uncharacterised nucleotidyltransferase